MNSACYRKLHRYKYQLTEDYELTIGLTGHAIETPYYRLTEAGGLSIRKSYAWDGPSGPTIDTRTFMRGSLVHDCLYQMMRRRELSQENRAYADRLLKEICLEDGMHRFRAWYVHLSLRWFGAKNAAPGTDRPDTIICIPSLD